MGIKQKVNGLFLRPFPYVLDSAELYRFIYSAKSVKPWYDTEVIEIIGEKSDG